MLNLNNLRDKLDMALDKETADSLNEWLNYKRNVSNLTNKVNFMNKEQVVRIQLVSVLDNIQSIMHDLTLSEMDELIDEVTCVYERFSDVTDTRNGDKTE